jgi:hypothetical protein
MIIAILLLKLERIITRLRIVLSANHDSRAMASILRKFIILHDFIDKPEFTREYTPYDVNMINAMETAARLTYRRSDPTMELKEITHKYWEFSFTRDGRRQKLRITSTDEFLDTPKTIKGRSLSAPRFK